ncbi:hypothetical protein [Bacillus sp. Bos-x628]|uniref:hypothetical protein n=1 Tax=Bacillus maqinnsis TaxID=3229854 RepID=UPI00338E3132
MPENDSPFSDEGKKHVMLEEFFSTYQAMNNLLTNAVLILIAYSIGANPSQLFSIMVTGLVLIILNAQYLLKIRKRSFSKRIAFI